MIFSLDLYAASFLVCGLWMLLVFSFLAGRHVKMGEIDDPHKNLFRPDNDLNVCNYDMFGSFGSFGTQNDNTSDEIACYVKSTVHRQAMTMWKLCPHTLYDVLHARRADEVIHCMVYVAQIDSTPRTTPWTRAQTLTLERLMGESINEWRSVLAAVHPTDFRTRDHTVKVVAIVEPKERERGVRTYAQLQGETPVLSTDDLVSVSDNLNARQLKAVRKRSPECPSLTTHGIDLTIVYENSHSAGTYGYVKRMLYEDKSGAPGFNHSSCYVTGVTIFVNDAMGTTFNFDPWKERMVTWFAVAFITLMGTFMMAHRELLFKDMLAIFVASVLVAHRVTFTAFGPPPSPPVVDGHPTRFSSDVYPLSLLTHELGHTLLMPDHYKVNSIDGGQVVSQSLPGPNKPFHCAIRPISIMGAESAITRLDRAFVNAMWAIKRGKAFTMGGRTIVAPDADCPALDHAGGARAAIENFRSNRQDTLSECAPLVFGNHLDEEARRDTTRCATNEDLLRLYERSCWFNAATKKYEPESLCNATISTRVRLAPDRMIVHNYMIYGTAIEAIAVVAITVAFFRLWKKNERANFDALRAQGTGTSLQYRELLDTPTIVAVVAWIVVVNQKTRQIRRCIGINDSLATHVFAASILLLIPLVPIIMRRTGILQRTEEQGSYQQARRLRLRQFRRLAR